MKNNFLSKAYGGVMEARRKLNGLGLPRQWKVITSTLLLLFTFAIGNVLGADDVYYVMLYNNITDAGVLTSSSTLNYGIVKYSASTGKYASSTEITVEGMGTSKASKYSQANISTFSTVGNWVAGSGTAYAAGGKFTALTIKLGTKTASSIKFIGYRNTSSKGEMTISETAKATAKKPSTYGNDCLLEWTGNFTGDVSVSVKDNKEHVGVFVITVPEAKYSVTYKAGDGTGDDVVDSDAKTVKAFADCSFTAPSGYEFKEWQDGSSNVVAAGATVSADMTLTAIYRLIPTKYTVTYNLNGASGDAPTETSKAEGDAFNLAAAPSWAGHAFDGWLCSADEAVKAAGSSYTMTAANTTFTAQWHEVDCKIYSLTGGIGSAVVQQANATVNDGVSLILSNSDGIIKLSPASGSFNAGDIVTISGTVGNTTKEFGVKISKAADKKATLGTASVAGTTNPMVATATLSAASDYLYICRTGGTTQTILTCEVHRACAEGTAAGLGYAEAEVNKTEGDAAFTNPLTNANSLVLDGYKSSNEEVATVNFSTGEVTIVSAGSATITANSAIQTKAGTLYAAGTASYTLTVAALPKYHVTYDLNGGSGEVAEVDHKAGEKFNLHDGVTGVTAPGSKTFVNWKDQDDALFDGGVEYTMPAKDVTLTAQWAGDVYTVKFMDGENVLDTKVVEVGSHPTDIEHPTKPLFTFAAWQLSGSDVNLDDVSGAKDAVVTLTARWTKVYAQDADLEGLVESEGTGADWQAYMSGKGYAYSTSGVSLDAKAGGKDYNNWPYQGLKAKEIGAYVEGRIAADKLVIIKLGHMAAAANVSLDGVAAGTATGLDADEPAGQLNYFYVENESVLRYETTNGGACVLKAITITNPFQVTFNANGGDPVASQYGHPAVTLPDASNGTKSLLGWFDAAEGGNKIGDVGESYTPAADIELFAQWEDVSTDARLASITLDPSTGVLEPAFDPEVTSYTYTMPYGTAAIPTITAATSVSAKAQEPQIVSQASAWGETAVIRGVAESSDTKAYNITMLRAPKDGISIIKVATTGGTNKTVTGLYAGDGDVNLSNSTKMDNGKYIGFTLDGTTLQAGDQINVHTTTAANTGGSHIIFYDNMTDKNELYETGEIGGLGDNIFTINAAMEGKATAYVYRSNADVAHQWNGYVDFIEVTRAMNPILKAITINSRAGEIDALNDHHFSVLIPYDADLAALTIVPTIVRNAPHATTPEAVISNAGDWIEGDNTYRVMDKDGDYTDYTITLTRDVLKHTVSFNTHGGSTIDPVQVVDGQKLAAAPADPTKDDYIFQGWAETEDGSIVDVTSFTISADKEFHAIWASDGAIKLLDGATVNHTNFITGVTADETVEFMGNTVNYAKFSGTVSGVNGVKDLTRVVAYNATTNKTKIRIYAHNNSTSGRNIHVIGLVEGASEAVSLANIALGNKEDKISDWIEFDNAANRTIYIMVPSSADDVYFTQVKVIESGEAPMKQAGEVGYSLNFNKGRFFGVKNLTAHFEGLDVEVASSDCAPLNTGVVKLASTSMSFTVASAMTLSVTTNNNKTYYVTKGSAGTDNETAKAGASDFDLTAGTWYITGGASNVEITNIAFALPKAEEPTITTQPASNHTFGPGNLTAMVVAEVSDGGTLSYQWYDASDDSEVDGATSATLTTTTEGTYYVIVTNSLAGHQNSSIKSDEATLAYRDASDATLSALSVSNGTLAPTFDPAELNYRVDLPEGTVDVPTLTATATMAGFADVVIFNEGSFTNYEAVSTVTVTSEDLSDTKVYTVHFYVAHAIATLVDVTENTTWDWSLVTKKKDGTIISGDGPIVTEAEDGPVIANYLLGENFDKVEGNNGAYAIRSDSRKVYQGASLHIHTTKGGYLSIWAANEGTTQTLNVANEGRDMRLATLTGSQVEYKVYVNAGDVVIYNIPETSGKPMRVSKMIFTVDETPDYTRDQMLGNGVYGTICVPYNVPAGGIHGITVYELMGRESQYGKLAFDEIIEMEAGVPYVFQAHGDELALFYGETSVAAPVDKDNGMYGTFTDQVLTELNDVYYFAQKALWSCADLNSLNVPANRAYVKLSEVGPVADPNPAPGRRRISMVVNGEQVATGFENVQGDNVQCTKVLINGQLFILRGEKMYDAKGQLVK